ncbi:glutathione peroxidase [Sulfuritalea hydrogenivorans]|jgi:glutathione peroxidase|uniref:Glutathione peroxidase n=1 Tax=Sulfuritalea hydrogenivorans sk43H TaxID=1223802 RepID=W0SE16_9PROT|nr:glutathione peroxidase [Sulfuritalea hydrogenivorans]MDK9713885.1 glutathione peroxidase [Sulfuritalea sp.]BAO27983.1 glutathione peroxidase [Sulfuritalea hydrogenivorans sk43H]
MSDLYKLSARRIDGGKQSMKDYKGKVLLIVNTASGCGFTPQYAGLEALWQKYGERGLVVLGFPCNQFGGQEPGDEAAIGEFCSLTYDVSFPMFAKVDVNGGDTHPIFAFLKKAAPGLLGTEGIKWNFTKFLVDREGNVVARYASAHKPEDMADDIEKLL